MSKTRLIKTFEKSEDTTFLVPYLFQKEQFFKIARVSQSLWLKLKYVLVQQGKSPSKTLHERQIEIEI